jgi:hypothetical protein
VKQALKTRGDDADVVIIKELTQIDVLKVWEAVKAQDISATERAGVIRSSMFSGFPLGFSPFQLRGFQNSLQVLQEFLSGFFLWHLVHFLFFKSKIFNTQVVVLFKVTVTLDTNLNNLGLEFLRKSVKVFIKHFSNLQWHRSSTQSSTWKNLVSPEQKRWSW